VDETTRVGKNVSAQDIGTNYAWKRNPATYPSDPMVGGKWIPDHQGKLFYRIHKCYSFHGIVNILSDSHYLYFPQIPCNL